MNEDINRILKGYKPKSDKNRYWILYNILELIAVMRLKIFKMLQSTKQRDKHEQ